MRGYESQITPGMLVANRFRVVRLAGAGGMGSVFLARDEHSGIDVALKVLLPRGTPENVRFIREARILSTLDDPGIVGYVAHGVNERGEPYLAMEWIHGETLEDKLRHGALEIDQSVLICLQVARALGAAHRRGVIHRDIKPSNIMCLPDGKVKVVDFGVATGGASNTPSTVAGRFVGTPGYIAPEQARGLKTLDGRADLFSLGGVLYICLTGSPAFAGEHMLAILAKVVLDDPPRVSELCEGVPPQLERLVSSMLSKAPELRPVDADSVAEELEGVLDGLARVDSRMPVSRQVLTRREMQVVSVVVAATYLHETIDCDESTQDPRLRVMPEVLESLGVTLERLIDGSFLCVVRTGEAATDQAVRAARAALALHEAHPDIPIIVATGRGVFSGKLPVGEVIERAVAALREHHATRAGAAPQSSAWGPPSSRWRHLESASIDCTGVQIDSLTAGLLDARFDVRADEHALWLFGEHEKVDPVRTLLGQRVPFVGREREIAFLEATVAQSIDDEVSRVVLVTADAGSGKSRLLSEFLARVANRPDRVEVWVARGTQVSQGSPFGLIAKLIRAIAAVEESDTPLVHRRKIEARVRRCVADAQVDRVSEFLAELCGVGRESGESDQVRAARRDPQVMADQISRAWCELVAAECANGPLLLAIDDLQWSDFSSIKLLDAALRRVKDRPAVILALARPTVREVFPDLWSLREVEAMHLSKLPARACERLARSVLSDLGSSQISSLVERADGNPFFLEELLRSAVFGKLGVLPDTVVAMAQSRLDTQPPESRRALRAASVFGDTFWLSPLKSMLDQEAAEPLETVLDHLVRDELIEPRGEVRYRGEPAYAFRHVLVRDAAYAALTDRDRALAHRIAARWLEEQGEPDVAQIAWHAEKGGLIAQAIRGYVRAAEQALAGNDLHAVIQRCEQAAKLGASGEELGYTRYLACAAHKWRGEFSDAERRGSEALSLLARGARWYTNAGELGVALGILGHRQRVVELAMLVIANDESGSTRTAQCVAAARLVAQLLFAGERVVGTRVLSWVEQAMSSVGDVDPVARAQLLLARGIQAMFEGDAAACIAMMEASAASSEQAGDLRRACAARINVASAAIELGGYDVSAALLSKLLEPAESLGLATLISDVHQNLGLALARLGRFDEAIAHESLALTGYTSRGQPREAAVSRSYFAQILALSGQWVAAENEARAAIDSLSAASPRRAYALAILAEIVLHEGRAEDAHAAALEASGILEVLGGLDEGEALVRLSYAKSLYAVGRFDAAREAILAARTRLEERASKISDPSWQRSFVELVGESVQTLQLAQVWASAW